MIDSRAIIDSTAEVDEDVSIGPFTVIGPRVKIGKGTWIGPSVVIKSHTTIGSDNKIFQFASVGEDPQDKKYGGEETYLEIGDRNVIREFVTINRGTVQDEGTTRIGNDNLLMAYIHLAHDCQIGNHVILANAASLGGHVKVDDWAILGGFTIVHQFCRIGAHCFSAMGTSISKDVLPFVTVSGQPAAPRGINKEGLQRRGFSDDAIKAIKRAYKTIYMQNLRLDDAVVAVKELAKEHQELSILVDALDQSERSIVR